ncbi:MAG: tetratricopeptide repeat protein [Anaerolineae bacterium]|nr:tetratricopeptide repeat protein [Anaerolineae bacterium]
MQRSLPTLPLGHSLQGRYQILKKLGAGGYGSVYLAKDARLPGRKVAIKELNDPSPTAQQLFQHEATILASLDHPGLVHVSDFFSEGRSVYLVMDYIDGRDLLEVAVEADTAKKLLPADRVVDWMLQVCEAVAYLHRRNPPIVHRDIKPNNIRLSTSGQAILVDFGIAKIDPKTKTQMMAKAVSEGFSPPEQYAGAGSTNTRSDVYALGATLYCLLTVTPPPDAFARLTQDVTLVPPRRVNKALSETLERVILKAMDLNELLRYQDAGELLGALQQAVGRPVSVLPPIPSPMATPDQPSREVEPVMLKPPGETLCPKCNTLVRQGARYCQKCGTSLISGHPCPQCGTLNRPGARFCSRCRTALAPPASGRKSKPITPQSYLTRGEQYFQSDDFARAAIEYEKAIQGGIVQKAVYANLGKCYFELNRFDDAVTLLETAMRAYPQEAELCGQLALAYIGAQKFSQGIQTLEMACQLDPRNAELASLLVEMYFNIGKHDKGVPILERLLRAYPQNMELRARLAIGYLMINRLREAERMVKELRRSNPNTAALSFLMGMINLKKNNAVAALHDLKKAVRQDPNHALAHYYIGEIYFQQKRWRDALLAYQCSALANPRDADPQASMCMCYIALGDVSEAQAALDRALQIDPNNRLALSIVAELSK